MAHPAPPSTPPAAAGRGHEVSIPRSWVYDQPDGLVRDAPLRELVKALADPKRLVWVDVDSSSRHQHAVLEKVFKFHPLAIEDTLSPDSRVKVEAYEGYIFMVLRAVKFVEQTSDPYDLGTTNLYLFLGTNYLVTVHAEPSHSVETVIELVQANRDLMERGPARLAHLVVDGVVDAYFPILDQIDEFIDRLEQRVFERFDDAALRDIFALKRTVLSLRRYLAPQREAFNVLTNRPSPLLSPESQLYFRDVYDHLLRINDSLDSYRELLSSTLDSYLTQVSNRLGSITKGLSVIATLSVPFVVVSGMWGMNFARIPLSQTSHGFWLMLVLQLAMGIGLVALLRWRKLL
jgi:magnesium transporter